MAYRYRWYPPFVGTTEVIGDKAITEDKIATGAVTSPKILDRTIVADDIADGAVRLRHLGPDVPAIGVIPDNSITTPKIVDLAVTGPKIDAGAVISTKIGAGSVLEDKIATNSVTKTKIKDGNVSPPKLEAVDAPADQEVPVYDDATGKFEWKTPPAPPPLLPQIIEPPAGTLWAMFLRGASVGKVGDLLSLKLMAKNVDMPADDWAAWELNNLEYDTGRMTLESVEEGDGIFDWKIKTTYPPLWAVRALLAPPPYQPDADEGGLRLLTLNFRLTAVGSAYFKFNAVTIQFADGSAVPYPATTLDSVVSIV